MNTVDTVICTHALGIVPYFLRNQTSKSVSECIIECCSHVETYDTPHAAVAVRVARLASYGRDTMSAPIYIGTEAANPPIGVTRHRRVASATSALLAGPTLVATRTAIVCIVLCEHTSTRAASKTSVASVAACSAGVHATSVEAALSGRAFVATRPAIVNVLLEIDTNSVATRGTRAAAERWVDISDPVSENSER